MPDATITIRPSVQDNCSTVVINPYDSERWALLLDHPIRSRLNGTNILGKSKSEVSENFCDDFAQYLRNNFAKQYSKSNRSKGGRPKLEATIHVEQQLSLGVDKNEIFREYEQMRIDDDLSDVKDSFKKIVARWEDDNL